MARPTTKSDLIYSALRKFEQLAVLSAVLSDQAISATAAPIPVEDRDEATWGKDNIVRDVLMHLYEWHQLLLAWVQANRNGETHPFLPHPYNWATYNQLNVELLRKHQAIPLDQARELVHQSHQEVLNLAETFSDAELFSKAVFAWVGGSTLGSYFVSVTGSHYDWAMKMIKTYQKKLAK